MNMPLSERDSRTYWSRHLEGASALPELPTDRPRGPMVGYSTARLLLEFPPPLVESIHRCGQRENVTSLEIVAAALQTLLFRYTGERDLILGLHFRCDRDPSDGAAFFLPLRGELSSELTFRDLLKRVSVALAAIRHHREITADDLTDLLGPSFGEGRDAAFTVTLTDEAEPRPLAGRATGPDLGLSLHETAEGIALCWEYNSRLFDVSTVARMVRHFCTLLAAAAAQPGELIGHLPLLAADELHQLLDEWNQTAVPFPRERCVHELFEEQVAQHPERIAVVFLNEQITYRELNARANRLAHRLRALGVGPDTLVAIFLERSVETVVALLATLKAGGAYVPLDPAYPPQRLAFMLADMAAPILLTQQRLLPLLPPHSAHVLCLDRESDDCTAESADNPACRMTSENLAYAIYTSGSTGQPKGVCIPHRGVVRLVTNMDYVDFGSDDTFLHVTSLSFDPSTFEIWMPLVHGARLAVYPPGPVSLGGLGKKIRQYGVTTLQLTTPMFHLMVDENLEAFRGLRAIVTGGEAFSLDHVRRALDGLPNTRISFCYGPTENTVITTAFRPLSSADLRGQTTVLLGRPIVNTEVYVLDEQMQPVPIGVTGELYTGGDGLARGYLNRPELTAERFLTHPFRSDPSARLYRTGDLARYLPDGNLEFRGRIDHQVKIRGYRVELGEVEQAMRQHAAVREAVVLVREDAPGKKCLTAYLLAPPDAAPPTTELIAFLKSRLPAYMVPAAFVVLPAFPLSPNGKLDRRQLPAPDNA